MFPKIVFFFTPQIIHLFIGFSIIFTIHFGVLVFLETPMSICLTRNLAGVFFCVCVCAFVGREECLQMFKLNKSS